MQAKSEPLLIEVSYRQLAVFPAGVSDPFNDWTEQHLAQGFSWRPESVSFATLSEAGVHSVDVVVTDSPNEPARNAQRVIEVPFNAREGALELASISESIPFWIPPGPYLLRCELFGPSGGLEQVVLTFLKGVSPRFCSRDSGGKELSETALLKTARPAGTSG